VNFAVSLIQIFCACSPNYVWYYMAMCPDAKGKRWLELDLRIGRARCHRTPTRFQGARSRLHRGGSSASIRPSQNRKKTAISAVLRPPKIGVDRSKSDSIGLNRAIQYCVRIAKSHDDRQLGKLHGKIISQNPSLSSLTYCARGVSIKWQKRHRAGRGLKLGICSLIGKSQMVADETARRAVCGLLGEASPRRTGPKILQANNDEYR